MSGLMSFLGRPSMAHATRGAGESVSRYAGASDKSHARYFAKGGMADPEAEEPREVSPELKLAAYELLACLDSGSYGAGPDGRSGRAEAFAKHLLAFFHLAEEMPHEEGPHEAEGEPEDEE